MRASSAAAGALSLSLALALTACASAAECDVNVTFLGPWTGGDAWLVNYTGPYKNDRPPHVQVGQDPDVFVGQLACLANCRAATSKAIEWDVVGVWNNALDAPAHMTAYYGPDAAGEVGTYCAVSSSGGGQRARERESAREREP